MTQPTVSPSKKLMMGFLIFLAVVLVGIAAAMLLIPYESGILTPAAGSGNLSFGGEVGVKNDLLYYRTPEGGLAMKDQKTKQVTPLCDGDCRFINVGDDWVYFVRNGDIVRLPLGNAVEPQPVVTGQNCRGLSVNGPWFYYTDGQGTMFKFSKERGETVALNNTHPIDQFTVDNRRILFLSGGTLYSMLTDGTEVEKVTEGGIERFLYTADSLYYTKDGAIHRIYSLLGNLDDTNLPFTPVPATVFNFEVVQDGSKLYYATEEGIVEHLLLSPMQSSEKKTLLSNDTDVQSLYLAGGMIYYFDSQGQLHELDPELVSAQNS